jgi:hypothetical protein
MGSEATVTDMRTPTDQIDRAAAVEAAVRALVRVAEAGESTRVTIPAFYPSGSIATVEISGGPTAYHVTDLGLAFREADLIGADHLFQRNAAQIAEMTGLVLSHRTFSVRATVDQLAAAIADVAGASVQVAHRIVERTISRSESEIEARLYPRLVRLFGEPHVAREVEIAGASSHRWRVSAVVTLNDRRMVFEAVSNHHSSVYSSSTMFHDLSLLEQRPAGIAVVRDKHALGDYLSILAQAANVIEDNVPDRTLQTLAQAA